ncbi:uncharacterized protein [Mytilus edulis]|uniref:uncharacterized protein n=1 Tax=Mytilus edulis TaxID=6550 RepID=UPI0039EF42C3
MKLVWCCLVLCILYASSGTALPEEDDLESIDEVDESDLEENDHKIEKRGKLRLSKYALKKLAKELRRNGSLARRAVRRLEYWSGGRLSANKIIDVIEGVADRLNRYQTATCDYFSDVGVTLGIPRWIGYQICNVAIDLLL